MRGEASLEGASADSTSRLITAEEARLVARLCPDLQGAAARRPADSLPSQPLPSTYPPDSSSSSDSDGASLPPRKQVGFSSSFAAAHRLAPIPLPAHAPPPKAAATLRGALRSSGAASCEPDFSPLRFAEAPVHIGDRPRTRGYRELEQWGPAGGGVGARGPTKSHRKLPADAGMEEALGRALSLMEVGGAPLGERGRAQRLPERRGAAPGGMRMEEEECSPVRGRN